MEHLVPELVAHLDPGAGRDLPPLGLEAEEEGGGEPRGEVPSHLLLGEDRRQPGEHHAPLGVEIQLHGVTRCGRGGEQQEPERQPGGDPH